jgi:hypothetical protein
VFEVNAFGTKCIQCTLGDEEDAPEFREWHGIMSPSLPALVWLPVKKFTNMVVGGRMDDLKTCHPIIINGIWLIDWRSAFYACKKGMGLVEGEGGRRKVRRREEICVCKQEAPDACFTQDHLDEGVTKGEIYLTAYGRDLQYDLTQYRSTYALGPIGSLLAEPWVRGGWVHNLEPAYHEDH